MSDDTPFRVILIAVFIVQTGASLGYLRRASADSTFRRREEGIPLTIAISVTYAAYGGGFLAYLLNPDWMAWSAVVLPPWVRWIGVIPLLFGAFWMVWSLHHLGENLTVSIATKEDHALVTTGPYRWVRHPLYSGGMLESMGLCVMMANWFVAAAAGAFWLLLAVRTPMEERRLLDKFGEEYRDYARRVGRFVPKVPT